MYRVKTYNQIAPCGLERFPAKGFEIGPDLTDAQAILLRSHVLAARELWPSVRAVARAGAGVNNVPVDVCTQRGVVVFNTPGANANSVKELTLAALLLASRDVTGGMEYARTLANVTDQDELHQLVEGEKKRFKGRELFGRTLGVVGLGAIGSRVARAGLDLGMRVVGYDPALSIDAAWRLPGDVERMDDLPSLFGRADYVDPARAGATRDPGPDRRQGAECFSARRRAPQLRAPADRRRGRRTRGPPLGSPRCVLLRFPERRPGGKQTRARDAAPRREHPGSRGELRRHGGRPAHRLSAFRQYRELGQLPPP